MVHHVNHGIAVVIWTILLSLNKGKFIVHIKVIHPTTGYLLCWREELQEMHIPSSVSTNQYHRNMIVYLVSAINNEHNSIHWEHHQQIFNNNFIIDPKYTPSMCLTVLTSLRMMAQRKPNTMRTMRQTSNAPVQVVKSYCTRIKQQSVIYSAMDCPSKKKLKNIIEICTVFYTK